MTLNRAHTTPDHIPLNDVQGRTRRIASYGIFLFAALKPFYLWSSGLPQIADFILVLTVALTLLAPQDKPSARRGADITGMVVLVFALYTTVVNLLAALVSEWDLRFIFSSLFIIYNVAIFIWFASQMRRNAIPTLRALSMGTIVSLFVQIATTALSGGFGSGRAVGTFNNPNQLGYYTVLAACILLISARPLRSLRLFIVVGILCGMLLALASLSKAAIGAMGILAVGYCVVGLPGDSKQFKLGARALATSTLVGMVYLASRTEWILNLEIIRSVSQRFQATEADDSLDARGYDRLADFSHYLAFGAGEGAYTRFESDIEFHSLPGNLLLSYGAVGAGLFAILMIIVVRRSGLPGLYIVAAIVFYGITHNGLRNSLLWIGFAVLAVLGEGSRSETADHKESKEPSNIDDNKPIVRPAKSISD